MPACVNASTASNASPRVHVASSIAFAFSFVACFAFCSAVLRVPVPCRRGWEEPMARCDLGEVVQSRVLRSVASPFHSVLREESTRHECNLEHGRATAASATEVAGFATMRESARHYLFFPRQNNKDVHKDLDTPAAVSTVALIGGTGFFARFLAHQCLRRGISVTVLARDLDKAKDTFLALYKRNVASGMEIVEEHSTGLTEEGCFVRYTSGMKKEGVVVPLRLELLRGDVTSPVEVQRAVRQASLVVYLASAKCSSWWRPWAKRNDPGCAKVDVGGLRHTLEACSLVDAHLVAFVPLFNRSSWTSPLQWYRKLFVYRVGYLKAARRQERLLICDDGSPSEVYLQHGGPLRFTLFRVADIVYPSFNQRVAIANNSKISDPLRYIALSRGDVEAKILANIVLRAVGLCRSSIGSRLDVTGCMRHGVDLAHVDSLLHGLRSD
ncbi:3-beta-hydroxy-Delta(5)-steroid dehydrogenase [Trypanosoma conorhini]|uniref:3-beta-hydroxy-Delta(5)-steroid dehydrogenase n=1 Tax=Trypanosoma conorhini TaxID=83891 RepID=A0A422P348_9TRYP|nr:3-beta-hydroxy-Delta(5)-steroid dehydrogenase [Trypanosoma conorhini]RNF12143.1 3-beta-hydroxy-Delta(5)-steroid dehydrogenase [Trypanosoma conorhini]